MQRLTDRSKIAACSMVALILAVFLGSASPATAQCDITADIVAMDQVITYNRIGAFAPAGMVFALSRDVFPKGTPLVDQTRTKSCAVVSCSSGNVQLRDDKRPRPLTLRVNEGKTICITLENLLSNPDITDAKNEAAGIRLCENPTDGTARPGPCQSEQPATRNVGLHVHGMQWMNDATDDGSKVGHNASSLATPGGSVTHRYRAMKEGAYVITSGPNIGGEGGSGAIASGLFGVLNVEPPATEWYRSQVTRDEMILAIDNTASFDCDGDLVFETVGYTCGGQPVIDYDAVYPGGHAYAGKPILNILDGNAIFHNEINAIITGPDLGAIVSDKAAYQLYPDRGKPFREFTVAFHDEIKVVQAFPEWYDQLAFTLGSVQDGFAINYGSGGIGSEIIANRLATGATHECVECKYEEFFLTSWALGDPAMIVDVPASAGLEACDPALNNCGAVGPKATKAFYPADPSNVWHGYMNDRSKIRNIHVGTEHHIFHLHAHQWNFINEDDEADQSNYIDAQALGPGSSFTYEITYGGGGNRNKTPGDSIFHCHFYPHFAQGMWGLWRVHDVFEMGSVLDANGRVLERGLPDPEICVDGLGLPVPPGPGARCGGYDAVGNAIPGGTAVPGVIPLPNQALAPMPGSYVAQVDDDDNAATPDVPVKFQGYPFYIAGVSGHRPPTPPMDLVEDGGLPRHVITGGTAHAVQTATDFDKVLLAVSGFEIPETGTPEEKAAMIFHGPQGGTPGGSAAYHDSFLPDGSPSLAANQEGFQINGLPPVPGAPYAEPCRSDGYDAVGGPAGGGAPVGFPIGNPRFYAASVIELPDVNLNKVGWHFGQQRILVLDGDVPDTMSGIRAPEPFVMRANTGDCVDYNHTNLVPNIWQLDDFQVKTPTDVIGQHIHLVKFDVTSADGSGNGWNYEDGTLSPDEVAERLEALLAPGGSWTGSSIGHCAAPHGANCVRTTRQRWYIDPGWDGNVFTHDHFGPSTHQQAGLYATLLVEPEGSQWFDPATGDQFGTRVADGGPTSWRADIVTADDSWREFYLEFADFQLAYRSPQGDGAGPLNGPNTAVNPSYRREDIGLPFIMEPDPTPMANPTASVPPGCGPGGTGGWAWTGCAPEAISAEDPGTYVVNYRNEPLAMRVRDPATNTQALTPVDVTGDGIPDTTPLAGDLSYVFSSNVLRADPRLNGPVSSWPYGQQTATEGSLAGDPFTPTMRVYEGDEVRLRVQVGAHEEGHNFTMNGVRWLQNWRSGVSGFRNSQMAGISEYFIFEVPSLGAAKGGQTLGFEDYMYQTGASVDSRWNGAWGLMRAYEDIVPGLRTLPDNPDGKVPPNPDKREFQGACPRDLGGGVNRSYKVFAVTAQDVLPTGALEYNPELNDPTALMYVLDKDIVKRTGLLKSNRRVEPLILRANAGDCINITLENRLPATLHGPDPDFPGNTVDLAGFSTLPMIVNEFNGNQIRPSSHVGLHAQLVEYDMFRGDGMNVGFNPETDSKGKRITTAGPGETVKYKWYAGKIDRDNATGDTEAVPIEYGAINLSASDPIKGSNKGLIGALIIEPQGASWPADGEVGTDGLLTRAAVTVTHPGGSFRDFVVIHQDDINMRFTNGQFGVAAGKAVPTVNEEEDPEDSGQKGINYSTDPLWQRLNIGTETGPTRTADYTNAFAGDPYTPIFTAGTCDAVRFRLLKPGGHNRNNVFTLHGNVWARHPYASVDTNGDGIPDYSSVIDGGNLNTFWHGEQMGHGAMSHFNVVPLMPPSGCRPAGDYLYRDMTPVHVDNGEWGIMRVGGP